MHAASTQYICMHARLIVQITHSGHVGCTGCCLSNDSLQKASLSPLALCGDDCRACLLSTLRSHRRSAPVSSRKRRMTPFSDVPSPQLPGVQGRALEVQPGPQMRSLPQICPNIWLAEQPTVDMASQCAISAPKTSGQQPVSDETVHCHTDYWAHLAC